MSKSHQYSEDLFADTRMSFGEHIEELRVHLWRAIYGLMFFLVIGFILDAVGTAIDVPWIGIGRPMMGVMTEPVREQLRAFYDRRLQKLKDSAERGVADAKDALEPQAIVLTISAAEQAKLLGQPPPGESDADVSITVRMSPLDVYRLSSTIQNRVRPPELTTLSVQEGMVVYFKVSLLCSLVLASPWVFWQIWSFIAAGLYPHEKVLVHKFLPMSLGLFLGGVLLCQFAVIPRSIEALLWFNEWIGFTPDLRLNEWLGFAIMLPLVFGISFQTPLVMLVLERIGITTVETYWRYWKMSVFVLAVFAAIITPTPDFITMCGLWLPMVALYFLGILLCRLAGRRADHNEPVADDMVEV